MIKKIVGSFYRLIFPESIRLFIRILLHNSFVCRLLRNRRYSKTRKDILCFFEKNGFENEDQKHVYNYLKDNPISIFPHIFSLNYNKADVVVFSDEESGLNYVLHERKRLYFKRNMTLGQIRFTYNCLRIEQDKDSPHRYLTDDFVVEDGAIVVDAGSAEGNFALSVVEKAKKVYLIESDPEWIEALEATFKPWRDRVEIVNKFASSKDEGEFISLDSLLKGKPATFIKIDIEGAEMDLLKGTSNLIRNQPSLKIIACVYHKQNDEKELTAFFEENGFRIEVSSGYMIFLIDPQLKFPYLRRGLIRATKSKI